MERAIEAHSCLAIYGLIVPDAEANLDMSWDRSSPDECLGDRILQINLDCREQRWRARPRV
jgi:hypothetical protein